MLKLDVPTTVFFAITVISVGFVVLPLWNYTRFYLALYNFDYVLLDVTIDASQIEAIQINVSLLAMNPTDYSGLEVGSAMVGLQYFGPEHEVQIEGFRSELTHWWDLKVGSASGLKSIGSNSNETILVIIDVNPNSNVLAERNHAQEFMNFIGDKSTTEITWSLNCNMVVFSFLGGFVVSRAFAYVTALV